ncbi:MAG: hypothetical protein P1U56_21265 [Saprospiraceae bacterium]|nr:hypothetical protein [Saprospiraceae bacterium]
MKKTKTTLVLIIFLSVCSITIFGQLSQERIEDIAQIKVERFQNILDLSPIQSSQLKKETINMMVAQSAVANNKNISAAIGKNLDKYYASLSSFKPQQLVTLKLLDSLDRQSRREAYKDLMSAYGQSSEFAVAVAAYNWNIIMPILVSYRKDLDRYISPADRAVIAELRSKMIAKYNFITSIREHEASPQTEAIVTTIQDEILTDIHESVLPRLLQKYDEHIVDIRIQLNKHEKQIKKDLQLIYEENMLDNHRNQLAAEEEFFNMLGISKLLKDSFLLLFDGDSRAASFKINTLYLMANGLAISDQF